MAGNPFCRETRAEEFSRGPSAIGPSESWVSPGDIGELGYVHSRTVGPSKRFLVGHWRFHFLSRSEAQFSKVCVRTAINHWEDVPLSNTVVLCASVKSWNWILVVAEDASHVNKERHSEMRSGSIRLCDHGRGLDSFSVRRFTPPLSLSRKGRNLRLLIGLRCSILSEGWICRLSLCFIRHACARTRSDDNVHGVIQSCFRWKQSIWLNAYPRRRFEALMTHEQKFKPWLKYQAITSCWNVRIPLWIA